MSKTATLPVATGVYQSHRDQHWYVVVRTGEFTFEHIKLVNGKEDVLNVLKATFGISPAAARKQLAVTA